MDFRAVLKSRAFLSLDEQKVFPLSTMSLATASSGARPPQQEHATLHSASSQQAPLQRLADVRQHAAVTSSRRQRLQLAGSGKGRRRRAAVAAATPAGAPAAAAELQAGDPGSSLELGEEQQPKLDLALAADDADVVNFFFRQVPGRASNAVPLSCLPPARRPQVAHSVTRWHRAVLVA